MHTELIETLDKLTDGEALIATEVGQSQMWAAQYYAYKHPHQLITSLVQWATALAQEWAQRWATLTEL